MFRKLSHHSKKLQNFSNNPLSPHCLLKVSNCLTYHSGTKPNQQQLQQQVRKMSKEGVSSSVFDVKPEDTLFAKIIDGKIKCEKVYENDHVLAFKDINPQAPTHILIISKNLKIGRVHEANESAAGELGQLLIAAGVIAKNLNLEEGYRLVINQGVNAQQSVNYLHVHLLSGRKFTWPPG